MVEVSRWVVGFATSGLTLVKLSLNRLLPLDLRCGVTTLRLVDAFLAFECQFTLFVSESFRVSRPDLAVYRECGCSGEG